MKALMMRCFTCHSDFQFGPHRYDGTHISAYDMTVCRTCYAANRDGWAPHYESTILKNLQEKSLVAPERNAAGWLPRDPS